MTTIRVKIPDYGTGVIVRMLDCHRVIVRLDTGKTVRVEIHDCEVLS